MNIADSFKKYKANQVLIEDFDYSSSDLFYDVWVDSDDADSVKINDISVTPSITGPYAGNNLISLTSIFSGGTARWTRTLAKPLDLTEFFGTQNGQPSKGKLEFLVGVGAGDASAISSIRVHLGSTTGAYIYGEVDPSSIGTGIEDNLMCFSFDAATASKSGTPDWKKVDSLRVQITTASGTRDIHIGGIRVVDDAGLTKTLFDEPDDQLDDGNSSLWYTEKTGRPAVYQTLGEGDNTNNVQINQMLNKDTGLAQPYGDYFTAEVEFTNRTDGAGRAGIAFHVTNAAQGAQECYAVYIDDTNTLKFDKFVAGVQTTLETEDADSSGPLDTFNSSENKFIRVENRNGTFHVYTSTDGTNFQKVMVVTDSSHTGGGIGLFGQAGGSASVSDIASAIYYTIKVYDAAQFAEFGDYSFDHRQTLRMDNVKSYAGSELQNDILDIPNSGFKVFVSQHPKSKFIIVKGKILTGRREDVVPSMKEFREAMRGAKTIRVGEQTANDGNYTITEYRDCVATNLETVFPNEAWDTNTVDFSLVFQAPEGFGYAQTMDYIQGDLERGYTELNWDFKGESSPKPVIDFTLQDVNPDTGDDIDTIQIWNYSTGKNIEIVESGGFSNSDELTVDFQRQVITLNTDPHAYSGMLTDAFFKPGKNHLAIHCLRQSDIDLVNDIPSGSGFVRDFVSGNSGGYVVQAFEAPSTDDFTHLDVYVSSPDTDDLRLKKLLCQIFPDDGGGLPDTFSIEGSEDKVMNNPEFQWVRFNFPSGALSLTSGNPYYIALNSSGKTKGDKLLTHRVKATTNNNYGDGAMTVSNDNLASLISLGSQFDLAFRLYNDSSDLTGIEIDYEVKYNPRSI